MPIYQGTFLASLPSSTESFPHQAWTQSFASVNVPIYEPSKSSRFHPPDVAILTIAWVALQWELDCDQDLDSGIAGSTPEDPMKKWRLIVIISVATIIGCSTSRKNSGWNIGFSDFGEVFSNIITGGDSDLDRSRRFWDQTSDDPRR